MQRQTFLTIIITNDFHNVDFTQYENKVKHCTPAIASDSNLRPTTLRVAEFILRAAETHTRFRVTRLCLSNGISPGENRRSYTSETSISYIF